jgi:uncharacterized protein YybS (DUF2232 family)
MFTKRRVLAGVLLAMVLVLVVAVPAFAAGTSGAAPDPNTLVGDGAAAAQSGGGTDAAQNLATELLNWVKLIIIPIAALVALPALFRRDVGHALVVLVIVVIVGAFAFNPGGVQTFVTGVANSILGTGGHA